MTPQIQSVISRWCRHLGTIGLLQTWALCCAMAVSTLGCSESNSVEPTDSGERINLIESVSTLDSVEYFIESSRLLGDQLDLDVVYSGGCEEHTFQLFASTQFRESNPVRTFAYLVHSGDDPCDGVVRETLSFDLSELSLEHRLQYGQEGTILIDLYQRHTAVTTTELRYDP